MLKSRVVFEHAELAALEKAAAALCAPFAFGDVDGWCTEVNRALCPIVEADVAVFYLASTVTGNADRSPICSDELSRVQAADFVRVALHDAGTDRAQAFGLTLATQTQLVRGDWDGYYQDRAVNEFYLPHRLHDAIGFLSWDRSGRKQSSIELYKQVFGTPLFDAEGIVRLRLLLPAFQAGVAALEATTAASGSLRVVLERFAQPLALADAHGQVTYRTTALAELLAEDPDAKSLESVVSATAARQAALFEGRGWGRRHRTDGCALAAGQAATTSFRTRAGRYRLSVVQAPDALTGGNLAFLVRVEPMFEKMLTPAEQRARYGLTNRELEVARLLAAGASNQRIAAALTISAHTARRHTERILAKLQVSSRAAVGPALRGERDTETEADGGTACD